MDGVVKRFNQQKGYGFIRTMDDVDCFFHISQVSGKEIPKAGDAVSFDLSLGKGGKPAATKVVIRLSSKKSQSDYNKFTFNPVEDSSVEYKVMKNHGGYHVPASLPGAAPANKVMKNHGGYHELQKTSQFLRIDISLCNYLVVEGSYLRFFEEKGIINVRWHESSAIHIRQICYVKVDKQWSLFFGTQPYIKFGFSGGLDAMHFNLKDDEQYQIAKKIKHYIEQMLSYRR